MSKLPKKTTDLINEPVSQAQINAMVADCGSKNGEVYFRSSCHRLSPIWCSYNRGGFLTLTCAKCKSEVMKIAVAAGEVKFPSNLEFHFS